MSLINQKNSTNMGIQVGFYINQIKIKQKHQQRAMYSNIFWVQPYQEPVNQYIPILLVNSLPNNCYLTETRIEKPEISSPKPPHMLSQVETQLLVTSKKEKLSSENFPDQPEKKSKNKCNEKSYNSSFPRDKSKKDQSLFRNIIPNIIHQVAIFVQKKSKSKKYVEQMLKNSLKKEGYSVNRFYLYQQLIKEKTSHYLNEQILKEYKKIQEVQCELYSFEEQVEYLRISRGLIFFFLRSYMRNSILTSSRMKPQIKKGHLELLRQVEDRIQEMYQE